MMTFRSVYCTVQKADILLGKRLGSGEEKNVYAVVGNDYLAVAIFKKGKRPPRLKRVIRAMMAATKGLPSANLIVSTIRRCVGGTVIGYMMSRVCQKQYVPLDKVTFKTTAEAVSCDRQLAEFYEHLNARGVYLTDMKPDMCGWDPILRRLMVLDVLSVAIDRIAIGRGKTSRYVAPMANACYSAPESVGHVNYPHTWRTNVHGLVCMIYFCLTGRHPSAVLTPEGDEVDIEREIRASRFGRFTADRLPKNRVVPEGSPVRYENIPAELRICFETHFPGGASEPKARLSAKKYADLLRAWDASLGGDLTWEERFKTEWKKGRIALLRTAGFTAVAVVHGVFWGVVARLLDPPLGYLLCGAVVTAVAFFIADALGYGPGHYLMHKLGIDPKDVNP